MGVSMATLSSAIMQYAAENAIESSNSNELIIQELGVRRQAGIKIDMQKKQSAENMRRASSMAQFVQEGVSAVQSVQGAVGAIDKAGKSMDTDAADVSSGVDAARTGTDEGQAQLNNIQLTEHQTLGERFSPEQVDSLVGANGEGAWTTMPEPEARRFLSEKGFSDSEVDRLIEIGQGPDATGRGDGLTATEAADFVMENRRTFQSHWEGASGQVFSLAGVPGAVNWKDPMAAGSFLLGKAVETIGHVASTVSEQERKIGSKVKDENGELKAIADELNKASNQHQEKLHQFEMEMLSGERQGDTDQQK